MGRNRMRDYESPSDETAHAAVSAQHFVVCPVALWCGLPTLHQRAIQNLYAMALAEALAAASPSRVERDLLGFWN